MILTLGLLATVYFVFIKDKINLGSGAEEFQCRVELDADFLTDTDIQFASCEFVGSCGFGGLFSVFFDPFELTIDKGIVQFKDDSGRTYATANYEASKLPGRTTGVILNGCTDVSQGVIKVFSLEESGSSTEQDSQAVTISG